MEQRKSTPGTPPGTGRGPAPDTRDTDPALKPDPHLDERLDEELDETFPASDPIPYRHDR